MLVFRKYIRRVADPDNPSRERLDASDIVSRTCYEEWCKERDYAGNELLAAKTYQRALTGHLSATDGRLPFTPEEEEAVLAVVRVKKVWCVCVCARPVRVAR